MGKPVTLSVAATGSTVYSPTVWIPDRHLNPFNIGFAGVISGSITYGVQHTYDDPNVVANPTWFDHATVVTQTANAQGNYAYPVAAIRVVSTLGSGTVKVTFIQAGVDI